MLTTRITSAFPVEAIMGPGPKNGGGLFADMREIVFGGDGESASVVIKGAEGKIVEAQVALPSAAESGVRLGMGEVATSTIIRVEFKFEPPIMLPETGLGDALDSIFEVLLDRVEETRYELEDRYDRLHGLSFSVTTSGYDLFDVEDPADFVADQAE